MGGGGGLLKTEKQIMHKKRRRKKLARKEAWENLSTFMQVSPTSSILGMKISLAMD